jgi:hypothetical protein
LDDAAGPGAAAFPFSSMCLLYFVVFLRVENSCILFADQGFKNKMDLIFFIFEHNFPVSFSS